MQDQQARLVWRDGEVPVSTRFDDPYFSLEDGLAETRHVFLAGNDLPDRFVDGFHIAELGFGTGLNLLAALSAWRAAGVAGRLSFTSFEAWPMAPEDMRRAHGRFDGIAGLAAELGPLWQGRAQRIVLPDLDFTLVTGDALERLSRWQGEADAWFLDGFSPAKNPGMWQPNLMAEVARHTAPGGTAATYTAAGFVRRGLEAAGFSVSRVKGYGRKRHMTRARLAGP
jgi:tRNA U34 5-methylaminomethyl-2-thiouridine-forming methyltransferase MnmC